MFHPHPKQLEFLARQGGKETLWQGAAGHCNVVGLPRSWWPFVTRDPHRKSKSMARTNLAVIHPASTSRIEAASHELAGPPEKLTDKEKETLLDKLNPFIKTYGIRPIMGLLEIEKKSLSERLLTMVAREGEPDDDDKVRYETDAHKFVIIEGENRYVHEAKLKKALLSLGLTPKQQAKVLAACVTVTPTKYVGVYPKTEDVDVAKGHK